MSEVNLKEVHDFWNSESCGERYATGENISKKFLNESIARYKLEPYIKKFANLALYFVINRLMTNSPN